MALPNPYPSTRKGVEAISTSIGATPVAAVARAPWRGRISKVGCVTGGAITTSNCTVTVSISPGGTGTFTAITGLSLNVVFSSSSIGQVFVAYPITGGSINSAAGGFVNEDDVIKWTPSNASGASIPGYFFAEIDKS